MICCVTGHRPKGFPFPYDEDRNEFGLYLSDLQVTVEKLIQGGYHEFISGMADGADLDFAEAVLAFQRKGYRITLEAALPCPEHIVKKPTELSERRHRILNACHQITVVSPSYFSGCMQKRNRYMVDKSDMVLAVWNGVEKGGTWNTIQYARTKKKPIEYVLLEKQKTLHIDD